MANPKASTAILHGVRILDLADEKAGFCTKVLADLGARVIRIEIPGALSPGAGSPDHSLSADSLSGFYNNLGKTSVTLDPESDAGRKTFLQLLAQNDIVVESFSAADRQKTGMDYPRFKDRYPRLIWASVTGFGLNGPRSHYTSTDLIASAAGGQMFVNGLPGEQPLKPFGRQSYYCASLFAAAGILMALNRRAQSGLGEHIDVSLQEAAVATLDHVLLRYFYEQTVAQRQGGTYWNYGFSILPCRDGQILVAPFQQWETLIAWVQSDGMAEDLDEAKFLDARYRLDHAERILTIFAKWTRTHTAFELLETAQALQMTWAPVSSPRNVLNNPQLQARRYFIQMRHEPSGETIICPGSPYRFGTSRKEYPSAGRENVRIDQKEEGAIQKAFKDSRMNGVNREQAADANPLQGLRVLDFTWILAGPYATRTLADFGAEVIKVQCGKTARGVEDNHTGYFNCWNRNKRSITLDLSHAEARDIILRLAKQCDIVMENFSPRVLPNWGLDYDQFRQVKPDLIMLRMSAMGQTGPWRDHVAYGHTLHALSGLTYLTAFEKESPLGLGYAYSDIISALYAVIAVLAAVEHRRKTGAGQYIDLSEFEAMCSLMGPALMQASVRGQSVEPQGDGPDDAQAALCGCYPCRGEDRWCVLSVRSDREWLSLVRILGRPDWTKDDRFSSWSTRKENQKELNERITRWTIRHSAEEVMEVLQEAGLAAAVVQNAGDLAHDPHLAARDFFVRLPHPVLGETISERSPIRLASATHDGWKAAPLLGEDNRYVFQELLNMTEREYDDFVHRGIIA